ncbi:cytidine/deoxycytidylate deaminase family protein [Cryptosporidium muris RN66]|uniref:Cytidine/deoxycytidylate deaminase family protein n=1 Tax=Cryptosporidium muris (strain RN66) TaxID=441375 RepID=B6AEM7_CRYMR|nr:cytidine/deoxycytidylate deaminase family protein [Cryptosporidium muris RN66]EEA06644.1 cytidine/deoxycytidylate deaminase family protein [Cryptosporidium muris RN66]|eukprot:XP_002140993.1 cytidine/deoxycytidylate deaminase family protein [Cryptosporidium muris RN66]
MTYSEREVLFFMKEALKWATKAFDTDEIPVGCILVNRETKEIESAAHNETNISCNATRHCEVVALERLADKLIQELDGINCKDINTKFPLKPEFGQYYDLFVTVEPCIMCIGILNQAGIKGIYYGCKNDRFGGCGSVIDFHDVIDINSEIQIKSNILADEAIKLLQDFYERGNPKAPDEKRKRPLKRSN